MRPGPLLLALAALALGLLLPARLGLADRPELAVRTVPFRTHAGRVLRDSPPGQRFTCEGPGLERIDVALVALGGAAEELELVLRADDAEGAVLRRASARLSAEGGPQLVPFRFEPVAGSAGRRLRFELLPAGDRPSADASAWVRFHGQVGRDAAWGDRAVAASAVEGGFTAPLDDLRALAVASEDLSTERGAVRLDLWEPGAEPVPLRSVWLPSPTRVEAGWAFFSFPPVADSAGRTFAFRIASDALQRFVGRADGVAFKSYHGVPGSRPRMHGATAGEVDLADRDLVFRAWSDFPARRGLALLLERAGWRAWAALLAWTAATLALARGLGGRLRAGRAG